MKITYPNGIVVEALLLSRGQQTLRVAVPGDDDARSFTLFETSWISEQGEPVEIAFAWEQHSDSGMLTEADCICSTKLASQLMSLLIHSSGEELLDDMLWVFAPAGGRVAIHQSPLDIQRRSASMRPN